MFKTIEELDQYLLEAKKELIADLEPNYEDPLPLNEMSPREKLLAAYHLKVGTEAEWAINHTIEFFNNYEGDILTPDEKKKIIKNLEKAKMTVSIPFFI